MKYGLKYGLTRGRNSRVKKRYAFLALAGMGITVLAGCKSGGGNALEIAQMGKENQVVMAVKEDAQNEEPEPENVNFDVDDYKAWDELLDKYSCSDEFRQALADFSYRSASEVLAQEEGNGNFSPLSLYYALALAGTGAKAETAQELLDVLGMENQEELALACRNLYRELYYREARQRATYTAYGEGEFQSALKLRNSLWLSDAFAFHQDYQDGAARDFYASLHPVDFTVPETGEIMGEWIARQTNGVLAPALSVDPNTALCIINTLYFYGGWDTRFSKERTETDEFTLPDGTKIECPMMNQTDELGTFRKGDGYTMSCLYTNNNCRMVFLLPDKDRTVEEFLQDKAQLAQSLGSVGAMDDGGWQRGKVIWKVPKFSFGSSYSLVESLQKMGVQKMFDGEQADFSGISSAKPLWVSQVIQESHIGIDEEGVEGAAYTMLAVCGAGMLENEEEAEMICDRPFIYGIQESHSGAWLFIGVCRNPNVH